MWPVLILLTIVGAVEYRRWRNTLTHDEVRQLTGRPVVETRPSGKPLSPLLLEHESELWQT